MFEKDTEEIAKDIYIHHFDDSVIYPNVLKVITVAVQKGAEFGYNKANEWHYVKDGDLPKENKKYWILTSNREPKVDSWLNVSWVNSYDVIAWKEIVLPELKESE